MNASIGTRSKRSWPRSGRPDRFQEASAFTLRGCCRPIHHLTPATRGRRTRRSPSSATSSTASEPSRPYLRTQLGLSDAEVGLHSSAMAIGLVLSGVHRGRARPAVRRGLGPWGRDRDARRRRHRPRRRRRRSPRPSAPRSWSVSASGTSLATRTRCSAAPAGGWRACVSPARTSGRWSRPSSVRSSWPRPPASGLSWGLGLIPALGLLVIVALDLRAGPRLVRASGTSDRSSPAERVLAGLDLPRVRDRDRVLDRLLGRDARRAPDRRRDRGRDPARRALPRRHVRGPSRARASDSGRPATSVGRRRSGSSLAGTGAAIAWVSTSPAVSGAATLPRRSRRGGSLSAGRRRRAGRRAGTADARRDTAHARLWRPRSSSRRSPSGRLADAAGVPVAWGLVVVLSLVALGLVRVLPAGRAVRGVDRC